MTRQKCFLELSSGHKLDGELIGAPLTSSGEMVFTTGMVGYSEAITDPSYFGQILTFSYPLIGNYGIPPLPDSNEDLPFGFESRNVHISGAIVTIDSPDTYHWTSFQSLDRWLAEHKVPGISGLDTRHLVHLIRSTPNLKGRIRPENSEGERKLKGFESDGSEFFDPGLHNILPSVSSDKPQVFGSGKTKIAVLDCGVKWNIIRQILELGCEVHLYPWNTNTADVDCDGWVISNGPGNPQNTGEVTNQIKNIIDGPKPVLGICLGHQLIALAAGLETERMPYGHRSHNQPVNLCGTRKGFITSQNHGYVVRDTELKGGWDVWFRNANDESIEGLRHKDKKVFTVQFHPEAAGGPRDTNWVVGEFYQEVTGNAH